MKNRKKKAKTLPNFKYMPPELLTQIFAALPVKTVARFRSVCKSWHTIIDDPDFVSLHLKLCKINSDAKKLLAFEWLGQDGTDGCLLTIRQCNTLQKADQIFSTSERYDLLGGCNGLLLMHCSNELRLWNPSIRKSLVIPPCPFSRTWSLRVMYLLGYANLSQDYKIMAISFKINRYQTARSMCVAVYTLNDQQWTVKNNHDLNISREFFSLMFPINCCHKKASEALIFRGAAHWIGKDPDKPIIYPDTHLISLDFDLEKFTYLELPFASEEGWVKRFVFRLGDSLAIFNVSFENTSIWVMKQESGKDVWIRWFSRHSCEGNFHVFSEHDNKLVFYNEIDIGRCLVIGNHLYNIDSGNVEIIGSEMSSYLALEMYSESLVLCKGYGAEDLASSQ